MDGSLSTGAQREADGLRERHVASQRVEAAGKAALTAKAEAEEVGKDVKKKTFGRTPDGTGEYLVPFPSIVVLVDGPGMSMSTIAPVPPFQWPGT